MPRQRRRRRRAIQPARDRTQERQQERRQETERHQLVLRPWWKPTLGIVFAFSFGLWLGGTLSLTDVLSAIALIGGAIGMGAAAARLMSSRMRENRTARRRAIQPARDRTQAKQEPRRQDNQGWRARQRFDDADEYDDGGDE